MATVINSGGKWRRDRREQGFSWRLSEIEPTGSFHRVTRNILKSISFCKKAYNTTNFIFLLWKKDSSQVFKI